MNSSELSTLLKRLSACPDAIKWAQDKDLKTTWDTCPRARWLLWLVGRMVGEEGWPSRQTVALAAGDCAATALKYVPTGDDLPQLAIETVRGWATGKATLDEVKSVLHSVYLPQPPTASTAAKWAVFNAYGAAYHAAAVISPPLAVAGLTDHAAYAATAAYFAAVDSSFAVNSSFTADRAAFAPVARVLQEQLVNIVRERIPIPYKEEGK